MEGWGGRGGQGAWAYVVLENVPRDERLVDALIAIRFQMDQLVIREKLGGLSFVCTVPCESKFRLCYSRGEKGKGANVTSQRFLVHCPCIHPRRGGGRRGRRRRRRRRSHDSEKQDRNRTETETKTETGRGRGSKGLVFVMGGRRRKDGRKEEEGKGREEEGGRAAYGTASQHQRVQMRWTRREAWDLYW